jgi:hypothetical protein
VIEASVGVSDMLLVLVLLIWMYRVGARLIMSAAQAALDAVLATSSSESPGSQATMTGAVPVEAGLAPRTEPGPTGLPAQVPRDGVEPRAGGAPLQVQQ